jgi:hypothetical protein
VQPHLRLHIDVALYSRYNTCETAVPCTPCFYDWRTFQDCISCRRQAHYRDKTEVSGRSLSTTNLLVSLISLLESLWDCTAEDGVPAVDNGSLGTRGLPACFPASLAGLPEDPQLRGLESAGSRTGKGCEWTPPATQKADNKQQAEHCVPTSSLFAASARVTTGLHDCN